MKPKTALTVVAFGILAATSSFGQNATDTSHPRREDPRRRYTNEQMQENQPSDTDRPTTQEYTATGLPLFEEETYQIERMTINYNWGNDVAVIDVTGYDANNTGTGDPARITMRFISARHVEGPKAYGQPDDATTFTQMQMTGNPNIANAPKVMNVDFSVQRYSDASKNIGAFVVAPQFTSSRPAENNTNYAIKKLHFIGNHVSVFMNADAARYSDDLTTLERTFQLNYLTRIENPDDRTLSKRTNMYLDGQ